MSRPKAGARRRCDYLARNAGEWAEEEHETLAAQVLSLIGDISFASLFAPGSRAEVSIAGKLDRPGRTPVLVSGQIDRLAVTPAEVLISTTRPTMPLRPLSPRRLWPISASLRSTGRFCRLYPQKPVRAALLWTETPEMMEIPSPALDAQLAAIIQRDERA